MVKSGLQIVKLIAKDKAPRIIRDKTLNESYLWDDIRLTYYFIDNKKRYDINLMFFLNDKFEII